MVLSVEGEELVGIIRAIFIKEKEALKTYGPLLSMPLEVVS